MLLCMLVPRLFRALFANVVLDLRPQTAYLVSELPLLAHDLPVVRYHDHPFKTTVRSWRPLLRDDAFQLLSHCSKVIMTRDLLLLASATTGGDLFLDSSIALITEFARSGLSSS